MATRKNIITLPNTQLRKRSERVRVINDAVIKVIDDMKAATLDWEASRKHEVGVALAAVQIDRPYRIIVIRNNFDDKDDHSFSVFINPEVTKKEGEVEDDFEGCLSVKDVYGKVPRYSKIRLRALNELGQEVRVKAEGFLARVLQHEVDHTNGIMFVDHIKDMHESFYKLADDGKLERLDYEDVEASGILR
jgi:peptide deformylase